MQKLRRPRLIYFLFSLICFILLIGSLESLRLLMAKAELDGVAQLALRYGSSGNYDTRYCEQPDVLDRAVQVLRDDYGITTLSYTLNSSSTVKAVDSRLLSALDRADGRSDCYIEKTILTSGFTWISVYDAWVGSARLYFLRDLVIENASSLWLDNSRISINLCSNRPWYKYDESQNKCIPREDVGRSYDGGDTIRIELSYDYSIGSSLGVNFTKVQLESVYTGTMECWRIGCSGGITFIFTRPITADYTLEVISLEDGRRIIHCSNGKQVNANDIEPHSTCSEKDVRISYSDPPRTLTYILHLENQDIKGEASPSYTPSRPNGPRCLPSCWGTRVEILIP